VKHVQTNAEILKALKTCVDLPDGITKLSMLLERGEAPTFTITMFASAAGDASSIDSAPVTKKFKLIEADEES